MSTRTTRRRTRLRPPCAAAVVAAIALAGCGTSGGPILHASIRVPMAAAAEPGSPCGPADLQATGPLSAAVPGSTMAVYDMASAQNASPGAVAAGNAASLATIGSATVPGSGTVVEPVSGDPAYPSACRFAVDVPTSRVADRYGFRIGDVYLPVPVAPRDTLENAGWVVDVAVNPQ